MKQLILKALENVIDPETGIDVVKMDMVKSVSEEKGVVKIRFVPTSPFCPMIGYLVDMMKQAVKSVKGVKDVEIEVGQGNP